MEESSVSPAGAASRASGVATTAHTYLFLALEADRPLSGGARYVLDDVDEVIIGRGTDRAATRLGTGPSAGDSGVRRAQMVLRLPGSFVPDNSVRFARVAGSDSWLIEDAGCETGVHVNGARTRRAVLAPSDVVEAGRCFFVLRKVGGRFGDSRADLDGRELDRLPLGFTTLDPLAARRLDQLDHAARSRLPLILWGETGTGKEVLARGVHTLSARSGPFMGVNCGSLTKGLAESQLFGHVRGAFSGARADAPGFVRAAQGGTLLLDEVGDLDPATQGALLRVLQEREVVPVGSARAHKVDVRIVATAPAALEDMVAAGTFRGDLYARLNGFSYATLPLRHRRVDTGMLVAALLHKLGVSAADRPRLTLGLAWRLIAGKWRFNVRELEQSLARAWLFAADGLMDDEQIDAERPVVASTPGPSAVAAAAAAASASMMPGTAGPGGRRHAVDEELRSRLTDELRASSGNVAEVARSFGKARMQIHRWMKRLVIDPGAYRPLRS